MNILYINHYAGNPELGMEFRPYFLSKEWTRSGHSVFIISASFSHLRKSQPVIKKDLEVSQIDGINYIWIKTPKYYNSGIRRIINILTFVFKLLLYRKRIIKISNPGVVISSSTYPIDIFPSYSIAKKNKAKLVFELHDMWPLSPMIIGGYSKNHPFIKLLQFSENFACRTVDKYISLLDNAKNYLIAHGLDDKKFFYVPNGYSEEDINNTQSLPEEHSRVIESLKQNNKIIIGYAGGHAPSNALSVLIDVAQKLKGNKDIVFLMVGHGPCKEELILNSKINNLDNLLFLPPINKSCMHTLIKQFSIAYLGGVKSLLHIYGTSPNKLTEYMLAGKPVIFSIDEPNSLVKKANCGFQVPAENSDEILTAINSLLSMEESARNKLGENGKVYAESNLNYSHLATKYLQIILN